jgi:hypothetical protein
MASSSSNLPKAEINSAARQFIANFFIEFKLGAPSPDFRAWETTNEAMF